MQTTDVLALCFAAEASALLFIQQNCHYSHCTFCDCNNANKCDNSNLTQEKDFVREDEEVVALSWAYKTLKEDIKRRKDKLKKNRKIDLKKMQKMQAYLAFKQDLEERSKPDVEPTRVSNECLC